MLGFVVLLGQGGHLGLEVVFGEMEVIHLVVQLLVFLVQHLVALP
jgi:hypothetical protein